MTLLTDKEKEYHKKRKTCYICKERFSYNKKQKQKYELYKKVRDHCHFTGKYGSAAHSICNLRYKVSHEIPVQFHNGSSYGYHLIIKELAEELKSEDIECLAQKTEKYISFSMSIEKNKK